MSNNVAVNKSIIVNAIGSHNASGFEYIIDPAAQAVSNRGDKSVREALVESIGSTRAAEYGTYLDRVVTALEAAGAEPAADEPKSDTTTKSIITEAVGYVAQFYTTTIDEAASAIDNRGDKSIREALADNFGEAGLAQYSEYVDRVITALEEAGFAPSEPDTEIKSIKRTIGDAFGNTYLPEEYLNTAVDALTEREYQIADNVLKAVVEHTGYSAEEVKPFGERAGLTFRPEPVVAEAEAILADLTVDGGIDASTIAGASHDHVEFDEAESVEADADVADEVTKGKKARIAKLEKTVASLETKVNRLVALAERHLGA